jgi:hypothetical protein
MSTPRGMISWMIDEGHLDEDDDPTIGLRSGKAKASSESGGFLPWDTTMYCARWTLGPEARLTAAWSARHGERCPNRTEQGHRPARIAGAQGTRKG